MIKDIVPEGGSAPFQFTVVGRRVFFTADHPVYDREVWVTDGTEDGTRLVKDINPRRGAGRTQPPAPKLLTAAGQRLFFLANDDVTGEELWVSDGTESDTHVVKDIVPGARSSVSDHWLVPIGQVVYFVGCEARCTLWRSDGTEQGTYPILDPGRAGFVSNLVSVCGTLFFTNDDEAHGTELWTSDGTARGTSMVLDINTTAPGTGSSPVSLIASQDRLYFNADDGRSGRALWVSDGTGGGTRRVSSIPSLAGVAPLGRPGRGLILIADDRSTGREPWVSDGTSEGTRLLVDVRPGPASSNAGRFLPVGPLVFFQANDGIHGVELWATDGTTRGTVLVRDINPGPASSSPLLFAALGGLALFQADDGASGLELWMSDGSERGTRLVAELNPGRADGPPAALVALADRVVLGPVLPEAFGFDEPWAIRFEVRR